MNSMQNLEKNLKEQIEKNKLLLDTLDRHIEEKRKLRKENMQLKGIESCPAVTKGKEQE